MGQGSVDMTGDTTGQVQVDMTGGQGVSHLRVSGRRGGSDGRGKVREGLLNVANLLMQDPSTVQGGGSGGEGSEGVRMDP